MKALLQRVDSASVEIDRKECARVGKGLLIYLGIHKEDEAEDGVWLMNKVLDARIFYNEEGRMSRSVRDIKGEMLVVSQVTLYGSLLRGNRPDLGQNKDLAEAMAMYEGFVGALRELSGLAVKEGRFGADMQIHSVNSGPVTFMIDTLERRKASKLPG